MYKLKAYLLEFGVTGCRRYILGRKTSASGCALLHGSNFYCDIYNGDGGEMVGSGIRQVFHECMVLVRLRHRHGEELHIHFSFYFPIVTFDQNLKILKSMIFYNSIGILN